MAPLPTLLVAEANTLDTCPPVALVAPPTIPPCPELELEPVMVLELEAVLLPALDDLVDEVVEPDPVVDALLPLVGEL